MNSMKTALVIGPSTGWLYGGGIYSLAKQEVILRAAGANSVEVCVAGVDNDKRMLSLRGGEAFDTQSFPYRSVHLPDVNDRELDHQLAMAQEAVARCSAATALIHPLKMGGGYPMGQYERMVSGGVPLAIENMDADKDSGFELVELVELVTTLVLRFVLDVQHAYEHDPEMDYAGDLLESLRDQLTHLHVSGETENNNHSLVCRARNAKEIVEFVGLVLSVKNVPLILEGEYATPDDLRQEMDFLSRELDLR